MRCRIWPFLMVAMAIGGFAPAQEREGVPGEDYGTFRVSELEAVIGNNNGKGVHRAWYNGIFGLYSPHQARSPYVPFYAGINLENFFDARSRHPDRSVFFEPRSATMSFRKVSDTVAELHQETTPYYGIESFMRFELKEPYYVDYTYSCIPHKAGLAGDFFGVFWASYIDAPLDKGIHFLRDGSTLDEPYWEQFLSQQHDRDSTLVSASDSLDLSFEPGDPALWRSKSPLRYSVPFYYGRFRDMVLIYIFRSKQVIRFAMSPTGGGRSAEHRQSNPAWDFQMIVPDYEVGREYGFEMRVVYKPWVDRADVLVEVRSYLKAQAE